jgi:hypothetical protein
MACYVSIIDLADEQKSCAFGYLFLAIILASACRHAKIDTTVAEQGAGGESKVDYRNLVVANGTHFT